MTTRLRCALMWKCRQVKEQRIRKMRGYRMSKLFQSWRSRAVQKGIRHGRAMEAMQAMPNFTVRRAFSTWHAKTASALHRKAVAASAVKRMRNGKLHAAWSAWLHKAARKSGNRQKLHLALQVSPDIVACLHCKIPDAGTKF